MSCNEKNQQNTKREGGTMNILCATDGNYAS